MVGVDLGGTNVRAQSLFEDGSPAGLAFSNPSMAQEGTEIILDQVARTVTQAIQASQTQPEAVGIAIPGHIDNDNGIVIWAPNFGHTTDGVFYYWENVPFRHPLSHQIALPIVMANDANAAALGEYRYGTGRNRAKCLVMLTVGTGIGGGVVLSPAAVDGKAAGPLILVGGNKGGAELGHAMVQFGGLDCNAGSYGSIEAYCQRDAIIKRAQHKIKRNYPTMIPELVDNDISKITPRTITEAADKGDQVAIEVWEEIGTCLGVGIGTYINVFAPDVFAVGGQIAKAGDWLLGPARKAARNVAIPSLFKDVEIIQAEQIEDAGMLGGAALAFESIG